MSQAAMNALRAAKLWLHALVEASDVDPAETRFTASALSPDGRRDLATVTLAETLAQIDAVLDDGGARHG